LRLDKRVQRITVVEFGVNNEGDDDILMGGGHSKVHEYDNNGI